MALSSPAFPKKLRMNSHNYKSLASLFFPLIFVIYLPLVACGATEEKDKEMMDQTGKSRFLALGDSYTIGESVPESKRWPVQLTEQLNKASFNFAPPEIIATTGWTTDELQKGIEKVTPVGPYDLVSLLIGVNNQYRGRPLDEYKQQFEQLLKQAIGLAGGDADRVFVVSIPDYGVTPFAANRNPAKIGEEIDLFNAAGREIAQKYGIEFVDITPGSRLAAEDKELLASDGLHPSAKMYADWVELILPVAKTKLDK